MLLAVLLAACAPQPLRDLSAGQTGMIAYPSLMEQVSLTGILRLPAQPVGPVPVVVIAHGTGGVDGRGAKWAAFFLENGIGSLEIDYFGPRGVRGGTAHRLPAPTHDIYSALKILSTHPRVDRRRLAVIGFSRGGGMSLESSDYAETLAGVRTVAHIGLYPSCLDMHLDPRPDLPPLLVLSGGEDHFYFNAACENAAKKAGTSGRQVTFKAYSGAYHGWDGGYTGVVSYSYVSLEYHIKADAAVTRQSMADVLAFLHRTMHLP